jgi:histidyl-tRNA synthetase
MPGVLELLPEEQRIFAGMLETIRQSFERFAFAPVETPAVEYSEILLTKEGGETERQVYFVTPTGTLEREGRTPELALRFDLTVPLARYVAEHERDLVFPFRRYQIERVYRGERPQRGRFREFYQCDADIVGKDRLSLHHDAETTAVVHAAFQDLGLGPFRIALNHRKLLRGLLASLGIQDEARQAAVLREVDKLDKRSPAEVRSALCGGESALDEAQAGRVLDALGRRAAGGESGLALLASLDAAQPMAEEGRRDLTAVLETALALGVPDNVLGVDLTIARGLDYYTGTVFETRLLDRPDIGSVCSGGRYDDLAGHYTRSRLPGVGFSIGATRLFWQLREAGLLPRLATRRTEVLLALTGEDDRANMLALARDLRAHGLRVESVLEAGKLAAQLRRADRLGIRWVLIAGDEERAGDAVSVKDLENGSQERLPRAELIAFLLARRGDRVIGAGEAPTNHDRP